MPLPIKPLPTASVEVNGVTVEFRSLSRTEAMKVTTQFAGNPDENVPPDPDGAEVYILMCGTGSSEEDVTAFRNGTVVTEAGKLVDAILVLSGLAIKTGKGVKAKAVI